MINEIENLKTGMIVTCRSGKNGLIVKDNCYGEDAVVFSENNWTSLKDFDNNTLKDFDNNTLEWLKHDKTRTEFAKSVDIMKVYKPNLPCDFLNVEMSGLLTGESGFKPVWERKEVQEMTLEQVCKELGKDIKIIK